jgi:hypothetical protein
MIKKMVFLLSIILANSSCNSDNNRMNSTQLREKLDSLQEAKDKLEHKYDSLTKIIDITKNENKPSISLTEEENRVLSKFGLTLTKIKTGYIAPEFDQSFYPAVTVELKNISSNDITESNTFSFAFINNKTGEQLYTNIKIFTSDNDILVFGLKKKVTMQSFIGWGAIKNQDISVRLYLNNQFLLQCKIDNREYDGSN